MSGETEAQVSPWTTDTLKYLSDERIDALYRMLDERTDSLRRQMHDLGVLLDERARAQAEAMRIAHDEQTTAMRTAYKAADKALDKASAALDKEFHEHLEQVRHENALALKNIDKQTAAALASAKEAVTKSEVAYDKRFESVNEFRAQLADQARLFLPRAEYLANHDNLVQRVSDLTDRMNRADGSSSGVTRTVGLLLAVATVAISIIVIFINVLLR